MTGVAPTNARLRKYAKILQKISIVLSYDSLACRMVGTNN